MHIAVKVVATKNAVSAMSVAHCYLPLLSQCCHCQHCNIAAPLLSQRCCAHRCLIAVGSSCRLGIPRTLEHARVSKRCNARIQMNITNWELETIKVLKALLNQSTICSEDETLLGKFIRFYNPKVVIAVKQ